MPSLNAFIAQATPVVVTSGMPADQAAKQEGTAIVQQALRDPSTPTAAFDAMLSLVKVDQAASLAKAMVKAIADMAYAEDDKRRSLVAGACYQAIQRASGHADDVRFMSRVKSGIVEVAEVAEVADDKPAMTEAEAWEAYLACRIDKEAYEAVKEALEAAIA